MLDLFSIGRALATFDGTVAGDFDAVASDIQRSLLDIAIPPLAGVAIGVRASPGRLVGGDYVDCIVLPDATVFGIGEVSGRALPSALKALSLKFAIRGVLAGQAPDLAIALQRTNGVVATMLDRDEYVSALLFTIERTRGRLVLANAGHDPPIVYRLGSGAVEETATGGLVLGIEAGERYALQDVALEAGDIAVFYTDGFTDARNSAGEPFRLERIIEALDDMQDRDAQAIADELFARVEAHTLGTYRDDASILVVRPA